MCQEPCVGQKWSGPGVPTLISHRGPTGKSVALVQKLCHIPKSLPTESVSHLRSLKLNSKFFLNGDPSITFLWWPQATIWISRPYVFYSPPHPVPQTPVGLSS